MRGGIYSESDIISGAASCKRNKELGIGESKISFEI